jgi:hypothetical protein
MSKKGNKENNRQIKKANTYTLKKTRLPHSLQPLPFWLEAGIHAAQLVHPEFHP